MTNPWETAAAVAAFEKAWSAIGVDRLDPSARDEALQGIPGARSEVLRRFAIWLEREVMPEWPVLRAIYVDANTADPDSVGVLHSWAVAATAYAGIVPRKERAALLAEATQRMQEAIALKPGDAPLLYTLARATYLNEEADPTEAEQQFRNAASADPGFVPARLYLAHSLVDRGAWLEALDLLRGISETDVVDAFGPEQRWRFAGVRELIAAAYFELGRDSDAAGATADFLRAAEQLSNDEVERPNHLLPFAVRLPDDLAQRLNAFGQEARSVVAKS